MQGDGRAFLYLADTAWSLFHRLSREEADLYLRNRAAKGFTVIQAVALSENDGLRTPNAYGERPLLDDDPRRPNERYFAHVDWVIDRAAEVGLTVALLPTWGDKWHSRQNEPGPKVFHDADTARDFARFVGRRYGSRPVIFVLGGDRNVETPGDLAISRAFGEGLIVDFYMRGANPALRFDDDDVRLAAYRALLAGAAGHTYGNNNIWQMWSPGREPVLGADTPWSEAIDHPGAFQMGHLRRLFESRPWETLVPDQTLLVGPNPPGDGFARAAVAVDRSFAFVYSPRGEPVSVDQGRLGARDLTAWWFDPRYGRAYFLHTGVGTAIQVFTPPSSGRGCDWVLVLDDPERGYPPPGETRR